jgi:membrane fusion protein (multidrug efflux system)
VLSPRSLIILLVFTAVVPFVAACRGSHAAPPPPPLLTVSVVELTPETIEVTSEWVATLDGFVNAAIRPQVSGYLTARRYREGAVVRKGDVLFEIDPRPFEAALSQVEAQLAQAQAQLGKAARDVARDAPLATARAIPQSQLDDDVQSNLAAQASVQASQAAVQTARLNLGFTKVRSLVNGIAAIATAQVGDQVNPSTLLTTVSQVEPIRASFSLSEDEPTDRTIRSAERFSPLIARLMPPPARFASAPRFRIRTACCAPASTARCARPRPFCATRCSSRSARSPTCRASRRFASSGRMTRWR